MQLFFIRHAQSVNNALWAQTGAEDGRIDDPELTKLGWRQAKLAAEFLRTGSPIGGHIPHGQHGPGFGITHLYASMMLRAVSTGSEISKALGLPCHAWEDIHEEGGIYLEDKETGERIGRPGCTRSFFQANFPDFVIPETLGEEGWWGGRPFEEPELRPKRAKQFLEELLEKHGDTDDQVAIVSHGGFYNQFMLAVLDLPRRNGTWFSIHNTAITWIRFENGQRNIVYTNRSDFLPKEMIT
jgi:2,3-bisphosphoglycerate-dependent phosphoglycerate mutase